MHYASIKVKLAYMLLFSLSYWRSFLFSLSLILTVEVVGSSSANRLLLALLLDVLDQIRPLVGLFQSGEDLMRIRIMIMY